ncbi:MAG: DUF2142 domain-containing protein [Tepidisphaeraceae bacterium]|jgi:uncharacterized membrane protein
MNEAIGDLKPDVELTALPAAARWSVWLTPRRVFLPLAWIFGTLFAVITPPFQVPDEFMQFYRAYQVSEGRLTAYRDGEEIGGFLPASLKEFGERVWGNHPFDPDVKANVHDIWAAHTIALSPGDRRFFVFGNVSWHSPMNYFPQAAAIALMRQFGVGPMWLFYAGRMGNLLSWSLLVYFAVRLVPVLDWTVVLLALTPMCLAQAASLSADATVNGVCFLFVAAVMRCALADGSLIRRSHLIGLTVLGAAVALAKTAYLPLSILFLLIPSKRFENRRRYWLMFALFMFVCVATMVGWSRCTFGFSSYSMPDVSPSRQAIFMLHHPLAILHMELGMLLAVPFISSIIGQLGWHEIKLFFPCAIAYWAVLLWTTRIGGWPDFRITARQRAILGAAVCGCWLAVFSLVYLTFAKVGEHSITGLQGRYVIPATLPFFLMLYPGSRPRRVHPGAVLTVFSAAFSVYALSVLVLRFYLW